MIMNGKKLYRIRNGAMIQGVCNGVAAYFDVDVSLVRLAAVILVCFSGVGLVAYIAAMLILPEVNDSPYRNSGNANNAGNFDYNRYNANDNYGRYDNQNYDNNDNDHNGKDML
jgi:phage shock protein PspC (stress-responsive transcriptional regulator)